MFRGQEPIDAELAAPLALGQGAGPDVCARSGRSGAACGSSPPSRSSSGTTTARWSAADPSEELESHWFIENFMVLANEQVASFLEREHVPTVYRVHDLPDPFHVDHLLDVLSSLGLPDPALRPHGGHARRRSAGSRARRPSGSTRYTPPGRGKAALVQQVLRAQARAVYQTANIGHFGLASPTYCHFTSPIRRYPDLLVHRGLLAQLGLGPAADHVHPGRLGRALLADRARSRQGGTQGRRHRAGPSAQAAPGRGGLAGERLRGPGAQPDPAGHVRALRPPVPGLSVRRTSCPATTTELNELETALEGRRSGRAYKLADLLPVRVIAIDEARGRVDLALAGSTTTMPSGAGRREQADGPACRLRPPARVAAHVQPGRPPRAAAASPAGVAGGGRSRGVGAGPCYTPRP